MIREQSKDKQIFENQLYSEDLLIRSTKEGLRHVLPFLEKMHNMVKTFGLDDLVQLNKFSKWHNQDRRYGFDEKDGGVKDETMKEERLNEYLSNKQKMQMRQNKSILDKKNTFIGSNVLEIKPSSGFAQEVKSSPQKEESEYSLDLDAEALELLEGLDLDEEIEDGVSRADLNRGILDSKVNQKLTYI